MSMMIKTNFGEFHFNLDKQDEQEIVNLALSKAINRTMLECVNAAAEEFPKSATTPAPVPVADLLRNAEKKFADSANTLGTNMANALKKATSNANHAQAAFGDPPKRDTPAGDKKPGRNKGNHVGFLHIKCDKCGAVKSFRSKYELTFFKCRECGRSFDLRGLKLAHAYCGCGHNATYHTNETAEEIWISCYDCRKPINLILNEDGTAYVMPKSWDNNDG